MPVNFLGNRITPAPLVTISRQFQNTEDGTVVGKLYTLTVKGKTMAWRGSPNSSKVFDMTGAGLPDENIPQTSRLAAIERKQEALRSLFSSANEGGLFEIQPLDGTTSISCNPRIVAFDIPEGIWTEYFDWTLTLQADQLYGLGADEDAIIDAYRVSRASNDWSLEPADELGRVWKLTHTVSAQGKKFFKPDGSLLKAPWQNAQDYVLGAVGLGLDPSRLLASGVINGSGLAAYNYLRAEHTNELAGAYSVTETWLAFDMNYQPDTADVTIPAIEDFTVTTRIAAQDGGLYHVNIDGTIRGLEVRDNSTRTLQSSRFQNAQNKYVAIYPSILARASGLAGVVLNPVPLSFVTAQNEINGTYNYQAEFDNRAINLVPGALTETIATTTEGAAQVFAMLPVLGRGAGPVLQDIGTVTAKSVTVSIEAVLKATQLGYNAVEPDTDPIVLSFTPTGAFLASDVANWSPRTGRYSRQTKYVYE